MTKRTAPVKFLPSMVPLCLLLAGASHVCCFQPFYLTESSIQKYSKEIVNQRKIDTISNSRIGRRRTSLNDLSEWRDLFFDEAAKPQTVKDIMQEQNLEGPAREICVLPFPLNDVILQGETKELCLYEERFHNLFEKAQNSHHGVVAMGLLAPPAGILQNMPICELESYRKMPGETEFGTSFSILATIRVVGRASLLHIDDTTEEEFMTGWCTEVFDEVDDDGITLMKKGNDSADKLEGMMESICSLEEKLEKLSAAKDKMIMKEEENSRGEVSEATMRRRMLEAELDEMNDDEEEEDDDDDDFDDLENTENRRFRFQRALQIAEATDMQGYIASPSSSGNTRSIQQLTALSWAYFNSEIEPIDVLQYRLRALEGENLILRLKLALIMLMEVRSKLKARLKKMASSDDFEDGDTQV